jgi:hypothetical protein
MNKTEVRREIKGNIGLFLTCVEVSKMNLIALPTSRNTKGLDLIVLQPDTNKSIGVQVKCSDKKQYPVFSSFWYNYEEVMSKKIISPFIFVDISVIEKPEYFILSKKQITEMLQKKIENYIDDYTKRKNVSLADIHAKEKSKKKNTDNWVVSHDEIKMYHKNWEAITDLIK